MSRVWAVAIKELRQIRRDRRTLTILLFMPTFFLFLYGYALNFDIRHVSLGHRGPRRLGREPGPHRRLRTVHVLRRRRRHDLATPTSRISMDRGDARVVLVVPVDFSRHLREGRTAEVQVVIDGDNANTATTVLGYTTAVLRLASATLPGRARATLVSVEPRIWYNPELRSTVFLVPGLIAFISMITAVVSTALSIVREKERGTMEQVRMAPVSTLAFVSGKTVPYLVLSLVGAMAIVVAAMLFFDLPMRGDWGSLVVVVTLFLVGALGTGILVSTMADTQQVAFQAAALVAMLPDDHPLGLHLSHREHARLPAVRHADRAGALFPRGPAWHRAEGTGARRGVAVARGAGHLCRGRAGPVRAEAGAPMIRRTRTLVIKEFLELRRSPQLLRLVLLAPVVQLALLGYAATTDVKDVPIVVVDADRSPHSRALLEDFAASRYFDVRREEFDPARIEPDLASGRAWLAIVVPTGFGRAIDTPGGQAVVQVIADGTDANSSGVALGYAQGLVSQFSAGLDEARGTSPPGVEGRVRVWYNPDLESRNFMVPGVLAMLLMLITANLTAMAIVRERELGTLDQLNVTPITRWELILGKLLPYALVGFVDVLLVLAVAVWWFAVPLRGSVWLLFAASAVYLLCTLGLGLFVSTVSSTQQQAMMTSTFFFLVPMMYLSGFVFPIENMPRVVQWVTTLIPLRYFLVIVRGIFLKGIGFRILWPQFAALGIWGVAVLVLAAARSRKRA